MGLGKVTVFAQGDGLLGRSRGTLWGFYGTDRIRVTSRLNLTLGLRWDPYWPFHALHGRMTCFRPGQKSDDEPRPSDAPYLPSGQLTSLTPNFKLADVQQWNLTLERLLWGNTVVRASYVGTKGTHLSLNREANAAVFIPGQCGPDPCSTAQNTDARRPFAPIGQGLVAEGAGDSTYHALQLCLERRMGASLMVSSNYTWGKAIDMVSQNANGLFRGEFNSVPNPFDINAYRGLSEFDLSHNFSTSFVWQLPSSKGDNFFLKNVVSRWQVSGIGVWQVSPPFSVFSGIDNSLSGVGQDHADLVPGVSPFLDPNRPRGEVVKQYFNPAAFQPNALGTFGNSGRNILRSPGFNSLDFAVMKTFPIKKEKYGVTFRAEFFNITNTPHLTAPATSNAVGFVISTPQASQILKARDPRILQFALKFNW